MKTLAFGAVLVAALGGVSEMTQRVWTSSVSVARQTADSAVLVAKCWTTGADSVRVVWAYPGVTRAVTVRASSCVDTLRVAKGAAVQVATVTLTPKRGTVTGSAKSGSATVAARVVVVPPPVIDSVRVDTVGSVVTPPVVVPPASSDWMPNKPAGITRFGATTFEAGAVGTYPTPGTSGLTAAIYGPEYGTLRQSSVAGQPTGEGPGVFEVFHVGNSRGDGYGPGMMVEAAQQNYRHLYFAARVFWPSTYMMHSFGEKFTYYRTTVGGAAGNSISQGMIPEIRYTQNHEGSAITVAHVTAPSITDFWIPGHPIHGVYGKPWNISSVRIPRDRWVQVEVDTRMNTPGQSDGYARVYVDGQLMENETGIQFNAQGGTIDALRLDFTRGGGASSIATPAGGQSYYWGRLEWWGAR